MKWQPSLSWDDAKLRAQFMFDIRAFFLARNIFEVETPLLSKSTITDPYIETFVTPYSYLDDTSLSVSEPLYLQTSPEYAMKRLLASGYGSIYQITKAFRDEPAGRFHNPEFSLLEWYRLGFDHHMLIDELSDLLTHLLGNLNTKRITYQELFVEYLAIDPLATSREALIEVLTHYNKDVSWISQNDSLDTLLQVIFSQVLEPLFDATTAYFVYDFPVNQASLAKTSQQDNRVAHRFECYFKGIELANGFYELTDASEQRQRFEKDNRLRRANNLAEKAIDECLLEALEAGLPDCAGVALGIDRLFMIALQKDKIEDVISFPISDA